MESLDVRYLSIPSLPSDLLSPFLSFLFHLCSLTECNQYKDCTSCYAHSCTWCSQQDNCFEGVGAPCVANPDICCMYIFILSSSSPFNLYYNDHLLPFSSSLLILLSCELHESSTQTSLLTVSPPVSLFLCSLPPSYPFTCSMWRIQQLLELHGSIRWWFMLVVQRKRHM